MIQSLLDQARVARLAGDVEQAEAACREAMLLSPYRPEPAIEAASVALARQDPAGAVGLAQRALRLEPEHPDALAVLAQALLAAGEPERAAAIAERLAASDPDHAALARLRAALDAAGNSLPASYVRTLFDQYAPRFDAALATLQYQAPALIAAMLERLRPPPQQLDVIDAGCGTGLVGAAVAARASRLVGLDLSAGMLREAARRGLYHQLVAGDVLTALPGLGPAEVVLAGDVLTYFGALEPVFAAIRAALADDGLLVATVELLDSAEGDWRLGVKRRFAHSHAYVATALTAAGLCLIEAEPAVLRTEARVPVGGLVFAAGLVR